MQNEFILLLDGSVKDSTRCDRYNSPPIECHSFNKNTPLPLNMPTFWTCNKNKEKLHCLLGKYILELDIDEVSFSSYVTDGKMSKNFLDKRRKDSEPLYFTSPFCLT